MTRADRSRPLFEVLWNLRGLALFLVGPAVGVALGAAIFGLPQPLEIAAVVMFAFSLGVLAILGRAEWRTVRLRDTGRPPGGARR